jgi:hypothetical protein
MSDRPGSLRAFTPGCSRPGWSRTMATASRRLSRAPTAYFSSKLPAPSASRICVTSSASSRRNTGHTRSPAHCRMPSAAAVSNAVRPRATELVMLADRSWSMLKSKAAHVRAATIGKTAINLISD